MLYFNEDSYLICVLFCRNVHYVSLKYLNVNEVV